MPSGASKINWLHAIFKVTAPSSDQADVDLEDQAANTVLAGPTAGGAATPSVRALVDADIPATFARDSEVTAALATHAAIAAAHHPVIAGVLNEPTGFPNRTDSVLSISTRTFTIGPSNGSFDYYQAGVKYTVSAPDDIIITDVAGVHAIYYDGDTLSESVNPSHAAFDTLIVDKILVGLVYWNATDGAAYLLADERHGTNMSGQTHEWLHDAVGAVWSSGLTLSGYTENEPDADASLTFELTDGKFYDEDIGHDIKDGTAANQYEQQLNGGDAVIPIAYRDATDGTWKEDAASTLPYKVTGTGRLAYNRDDGGSFSQQEVTDGKWVSATLVATNDWQYPIKMVQGQNEYTDKKTALEEAAAEILSWGTMLTPEIRILYRFVMQTKSAYGSTPNAQIVEVTDFRRSSVTGARAAVLDHGTLGGLGDPDHDQYILKTLFDAQTVLAATSDDIPAALAIAEQRLVGRLTGGNVAAITIGIADNNMVQVDGPGAGAPATGEYPKWTANGLESKSVSEVRGDLNVADGADVTGDNAPKAHAAAHADGAGDELAVQDLASDGATDGQVFKADGAGAVAVEDDTKPIVITIDGGGNPITTGIKGYMELPINVTVEQVTMVADQSGSIVVDIWARAYSTTTLPVDGDSITASAPPTIAAAVASRDATLTGWTKTLGPGVSRDVIGWNVDSVTDIEHVTITLKVKRT